MDTRPTTDKIKETLFNILQRDVPGAYFLDLFAGSGQIGLEALSRGASYAVFIENNRKAAKCIEDNIAFTKFTEKSKLLTTDVISGLHQLEGKYTFDLILWIRRTVRDWRRRCSAFIPLKHRKAGQPDHRGSIPGYGFFLSG